MDSKTSKYLFIVGIGMSRETGQRVYAVKALAKDGNILDKIVNLKDDPKKDMCLLIAGEHNGACIITVDPNGNEIGHGHIERGNPDKDRPQLDAMAKAWGEGDEFVAGVLEALAVLFGVPKRGFSEDPTPKDDEVKMEKAGSDVSAFLESVSKH